MRWTLRFASTCAKFVYCWFTSHQPVEVIHQREDGSRVWFLECRRCGLRFGPGPWT